MKKRETSLLFLRANLSLFKCPVCHSSFKQVTASGPLCLEGHAFDVSKKGTIHFLLKNIKSEYGQSMLTSRQEIMQSGLFDSVLESIFKKTNHKKGTTLDVGCGEGTHLSKLTELGLLGPHIGFDISKEGIQLAAASSNEPFWCVADLSDSPFASDQFDTILNILSPSHYSEFHRLLKDNGQLIKVVPEENYLIELRKAFYEEKSKKTLYSNKEVVTRFSEEFPNYEMERITYTLDVLKKHKRALMDMTPLSWNVSDSVRQLYIEKGPDEVTVDLLILTANKDVKNK